MHEAKKAQKDIKGFRKEALEELEEETNILIDERCKEVAQELLDSQPKRGQRRRS